MQKISNWFLSGQEVQYGLDIRGLAYCGALAAVVLLGAFLHRGLGFWFPHQSPLRLFERDISGALPSTIEHALTAFALISIVVLTVCGTKSTTRLRFMACVIVGFCYAWLTTFGWDWHQYLLSHDDAQLAQMAGDISGLVSATFWLTRPVRRRWRVQRFRLSHLLR